MPALKGAKATSFDAYTTTIKLHDEHGLPCSYEKVELRLPAGASLMINDLYYSFGEHPIEIESDAKGHITLVDMVKGSLSANSFTVNAVGSEQKVLINPMSEAYAKLSQLNTADKLRNAKVHYEGGERQSEPLVSADVSENELKAIATVIQSLDECHSHIELTMQARLKDSMLPCIYQAEKVPHKGLEQFGIFDGIRHAIGDLFNWIKSGIDAAVSFMQGICKKVWYFVVTLG